MDCPICYDVVEGDKVRKLNCEHTLCMICLQRLRSKLCPFCRAPITIPYKQRLLPTNNDEDELDLDDSFFWEDVDGYEFEFSVQIAIPQRRRRHRSLSFSDVTPVPRRRARRRRRRIHSDSDAEPPVVPLVVDPDEIVTPTPVLMTERAEPQSESDKDRQRARSGRDTWRIAHSHNAPRRRW